MDNPEKAALTKQLADARKQLTRSADAVAWEADVGRKVKRSFKQHPAVWIGAATFSGLVLALLLTRKRRPKIITPAAAPAKAVAWYIAVPAALIKLIFPAIQPFVTEFLTKSVVPLLRKYLPK